MQGKSTSSALTLSLFDGKCCADCNFWKPFTEFSVKRKTSVGLNYMSYCRPCHNARVSATENKKLEDAEYRKKRNASCREYMAAHWRDQYEKVYEKDPSYRAGVALAYRQRHPDRVITNARRFRQKNKVKIVLKNRNRECLKKSAPGKLLLEEWEAIKARQNYTCLHCHRSEPEIKLSIDHIIPLSKGGTNYAANIQALCKSCNSIKGNRLI